MMTLNANKQKMKYALLDKQIPILTEYVDEDGNSYQIETGNYELGYSLPVSFYANISFSNGESKTEEYGVDIGDYDAVMVLGLNEIPITETSLIWFKSEVGYKDTAETIVDGDTADFKVVAIKPSLNQMKVILKAITK